MTLEPVRSLPALLTACRSETPPAESWVFRKDPGPQLLSPPSPAGTRDSPLVWLGCREMGVELEGGVATAAEQVREPSSEGQGFRAGSAEASERSRPPLCGDPRFGFRSPGPGAKKGVENGAAQPHPMVGPPHGGLEAEAAGHTDHGDKSQAVRRRGSGLRGDLGRLALALTLGLSVSPERLGENEGQAQEAKLNVGTSLASELEGTPAV